MIHSSTRRSTIYLTGLIMVVVSAVVVQTGVSRPATLGGASYRAVAAADGAPPQITVTTLRPGTAPGLLFLTAQSTSSPNTPRGPEIVDNQGRPIWFRPIAAGTFATCLQVQTYHGQKVLTWWEGGSTNTGLGAGTDYIADQNYQIIATINGVEAPDLHEFRLTAEGTALVPVVQIVPVDLRRYGGPQNGRVVDDILLEIDIATGQTLLRWDSLEHVPIDDTEIPVSGPTGPDGSSPPVDYFHLNSAVVDTDGNILISGRHTNALYKIDRHTGETIWRLGGHKSDFRLGLGVRFNWQHDAEVLGPNTYSVFDNEARNGLEGYESRVVVFTADPQRHTTTFVRQYIHPDPVSSVLEGSSQPLPHNHAFVSWGSAGRISEFAANGTLLFDATLPTGSSSYRANRFPWQGRPLADPTITIDQPSLIHAVWNGATGVARWRVLGGATPDDLKPVVETARNGLDTTIQLTGDTATRLYLQAQALDAAGKVIGRSAVTPVGS